MKALNQVWKKKEDGAMELVFEEEVEMPELKKTIEERVAELEKWRLETTLPPF